MLSTRVLNGLVRVVQGHKIMLGLFVPKGGITSNGIGIKGLGARKARPLGQIQPRVPAWRLGIESCVSGLPHVIFPGNVADEYSLKGVFQILRGTVDPTAKHKLDN